MDKSKDLRELHPKNIISTLPNKLVSKLDKSKLVKDEHSLNILFIVVTEEVSNLVSISKFDKELQP